MIPAAFDYVRPGSIEEALAALADPDAKALAGGHSLIPALKVRLARPSVLVDLRDLDLRGVAIDEAAVTIGALTTYGEAARALAGVSGVDALREAIGSVGDLQIRNAGTIGGCIAHADPASDVAAAVLALGARLTAQSPAGTREIAADDLFLGPFTTALAAQELITEITIPRGGGSAYASVEDLASGYPLAGAAVRLARAGESDGSCRVALTGALGAPSRLPSVEALIEREGVEADLSAALSALELATDDVAYRRHLVEVVVRRAAARAVERSAA